MRHDTLAVLAIADFAPDDGAPLRRCGDATLVPLALPFTPADPKMMAFALRVAIGDALDGHADPRGVLFLPATADPHGADYAAIVAAHAAQGCWAPWPEEIDPDPPQRPPGADAPLVAQMATTLGADQSEALLIPLEVALINEIARPEAPGTAGAAEARIASAMGTDFAARLTVAMRARLVAEIGAGTAPPPIRID